MFMLTEYHFASTEDTQTHRGMYSDTENNKHYTERLPSCKNDVFLHLMHIC
jgi:hypothetical protein